MGLGFTYLFDTYPREITAEFGWTRASFSAAHASRLVALALASPLAGWATERLGPRAVLGTGLVVLGTVGLAFLRRETGVVQESRLARRASAGPTAPQ